MQRQFYYLLKVSVFILLCFPFKTNAQTKREVNYVRGEILIQPMPNKSVHTIVKDFQTFNNQPTNLKVKDHLSTHIRVWKLTFDYSQINEFELINAMYLHPDVSLVQVNHKVTMRSTTPNDAQFNSQWQYINTGQSGGTPGADLDADSAWSITTGGLTPLGDTIVVAVLDDGIDVNHTDFGDNLWVNHDEIPNNNIDDDGNGYVDDYRGWNISSIDDNIVGGSHGTPVAGIVGAQGDNNTGVSGVNWNVKVMVVKNDFNTTESQVIEAYSYPLTMRKRYNTSNGTQGAFVVSTNASWGVNFGQPSSAPIWCAFYDTLGAHGIMNCGATANLGIDVDVQGDLPTACSSDYMLSVTNMDDTDNKVNQAGWGATTIDIGAFGEGTHTTAQGGGYGGFGGTSGATPHVAGMIGLLYSAPCPAFATLAKTDPQLAAFLTKQFILDGSDPNASLNGITVSGGRMNMAGALNELINTFCSSGSVGCVPAIFLEANNLSDTSATLSWFSASDTVQQFNLQYKPVTDTTWMTISDTTSSIILSNLMPCTNYEFRVEVVCDSTSSSGYSAVQTFKTDGCCEPPQVITVNNITDSTATIDWEAVLAAQSYIVEYRKMGTMPWITDTTMLDSLNLIALEFCTAYEIRIQTVCDTGNTAFSPIYSFSTNCGNCTSLPYCDSDGDTGFEHIDAVMLNTINNTSGDDNGYGDYTTISTDLEQNTPYTITLTPGYVFGADPESFRVRIDLNQDGDLNDPGELVFTQNNVNTTVSGTITIPNTALLGTTRMRISMRYNQGVGPCAQGFEGEVEDYCIKIVPQIIACAAPGSADTLSVDTSSAMVGWVIPNFTTNNIVRYRLAGAATWITDTTSNNSYFIDNLMSCMDYEVEIGGICTLGDTLWSNTISFTTDCYTIACGPPMNPDTVTVDTYSVNLGWAVANYSVQYIVRYKIAGAALWSTDTTTTTNYALSNLLSCTNYQAQIGAICVLGDTLWTSTFDFKTDCKVATQEQLQTNLSFRVFPNPFSETLNVRFKLKQQDEINLELLSINGQVLTTQNYDLAAGEHILKLYSQGKLAAGVYIVKMITADGIIYKKVVKQ